MMFNISVLFFILFLLYPLSFNLHPFYYALNHPLSLIL
jgi:hypothetical protein